MGLNLKKDEDIAEDDFNDQKAADSGDIADEIIAGFQQFRYDDAPLRNYVDTFKAEMSLLPHTEMLYQKQLDSVGARVEEMKKDIRFDAICSAACGLSAFLMLGFMIQLERLRAGGIFAILYVVLSGLVPAAELVILLFVMPVFLRRLVKTIASYRLMTSETISDEKLERTGVITFRQERDYLKSRLREIDLFRKGHTEDGERIGEDNRDRGIAIGGAEYMEGWTEEQTEDIHKLRELVQYKEYRATPITKEGAVKTALIGAVPFLCVMVFIIFRLFKRA